VLWGNYNGRPVRTITILDGITSKLSADKIVYDQACDLVENKVTESYFSKSSMDGKKGLKVTYWNSGDRTGDVVATQQIADPIKLTTAGQHEFASGVKLVGFSGKFETEFEAIRDEEIVFKFGATGYFALLVNGETLVKYSNWRTLPSRHPFKVEKGKKYKIEVHYAQLNNWQANIEFNFGKEVDVDFTNLIKKLEGVDVVVFAGGLSTQLEGEEMPVSFPGFKGGDRTDIELPLVQRNCLKELKKAGKKVIFVNCSGSAIGLMPETQSCDAILQAWYGGESGGQAVADVLFGEYNPSGKLPITFYRDTTQLADFEDYSMKGRTYRFMSDALFPFGFGLSYTKFNIGKGRLTTNTILTNGSTRLTVPVANAGKVIGTEIVQVYVRKVNDIDGPLKTLRAFQRVTVAAGKTAEASIELPASSFEFFDRKSGKMTIAPGPYEVLYGRSSDKKDLKIEKVIVQ
jgi:beta-glucosidase